LIGIRPWSFMAALFRMAKNSANMTSKRWPKFIEEIRRPPNSVLRSAIGGRLSAGF
jgi:hypothetical protein